VRAVLGSSGSRERRLAGPAGPGEGDEPHVGPAEERGDRGLLEVAAHELRERRQRRCVGPGAEGEGGVVLEDPPLEGAEVGRRLEPELVQARSRVPVRGERVGVASRAVEGKHPLGLEPFAVRVRRDERVELPDERGVLASLEVGGDPRLEHGQAALLEPGGLCLGERLVGNAAERRPAPERERLPQVGGVARCAETAEPLGVELARLHADEVAGRPRHDALRAERLAEGVNVHLQRSARARGRALAPDPVDQPVGRDHLVRVEQEQRQERPRALAPERHRPAVVGSNLDRPQQPELHDPVRLLKPVFGRS